MHSQLEVPQAFVGNWPNMDYLNERTVAYPNVAYPQYGSEATFDNVPFDTHSIPHDEKFLAMSSLGYAVAPADIGPAAAASVKPSFLAPALEVGTQAVLDAPFASSPVASSFPTDLAYQQRWAEQHSSRSLSPEESRDYIPTQESWEYDYPLAEAEAYGHGAFHLGELERRPVQVHRRQSRYEQSAYRIEGQDSKFMCTVGNCGKTFSGEWEKKRHIKSMHCPPSIGCRLCSYKQSRMDLFSEHCKKRHPDEPMEELKVQLEVPEVPDA